MPKKSISPGNPANQQTLKPNIVGNASTPSQQVDYGKLNSLLGGLIQSLSAAPKLLEQSGLEDLRRRIKDLQRQSLAGKQSGRLTETVDQICLHVQANLNQRLTMADLESISGLSARTLQYQFKNRFGCSPMRWILQQRLQACHQRFLYPQEGDSITSVAIYYGFSNLGNFARLYSQHLGELPSQTLAKGY